jgi:hypothetical protein
MWQCNRTVPAGTKLDIFARRRTRARRRTTARILEHRAATLLEVIANVTSFPFLWKEVIHSGYEK